MTVTLTLYGRQFCPLCYEMERQLEPYRAHYGFELAVVDIDSSAELVGAYDQSVPVLMAGETQLCHYELDRDVLDAYFRKMQ
jgi:glutaredoxin